MSANAGVRNAVRSGRFTWLSFCLGLFLILGFSAAPAPHEDMDKGTRRIQDQPVPSRVGPLN